MRDRAKGGPGPAEVYWTRPQTDGSPQHTADLGPEEQSTLPDLTHSSLHLTEPGLDPEKSSLPREEFKYVLWHSSFLFLVSNSSSSWFHCFHSVLLLLLHPLLIHPFHSTQQCDAGEVEGSWLQHG